VICWSVRLGPVVELLGLCNCMFPPLRKPVETTTAWAPVYGGLIPVSSISESVYVDLWLPAVERQSSSVLLTVACLIALAN